VTAVFTRLYPVVGAEDKAAFACTRARGHQGGHGGRYARARGEDHLHLHRAVQAGDPASNWREQGQRTSAGILAKPTALQCGNHASEMPAGHLGPPPGPHRSKGQAIRDFTTGPIANLATPLHCTVLCRKK
jgi:hypothetical protein